MKLMSLILSLVLVLGSMPAFATSGMQNDCFQHTVYLSGTTTGRSGDSYASAKPLVDGDLWAIPANTLITKVYAIVDVAVTGTTVLEVGDDDDADGFVVDLASGLGTPAMYGWDAKTAGAYLRISTAGATDAGDIYVVPNAKFYSAAGKEVKLNVTTANTGGKVRVVIEACRMKATGL